MVDFLNQFWGSPFAVFLKCIEDSMRKNGLSLILLRFVIQVINVRRIALSGRVNGH